MKGLYFLGGAAVGSMITFFAVRAHFRKKAEEEIASFRDYYNKKTEETEENKEAAKNYVDLVVSEGYVPSQEAVAATSIPVDNDITLPTIYAITEEEYGNEEGYDAIPTYIYYANGILVDEAGDEMSQDSISRMVGSDFYTRLGGVDCIWLRNTELKCDFEICADEADFEPMTRQG